MNWAWIILGLSARVGLDLTTKAYKHRGYINRFISRVTRIPIEYGPFILIWLILSLVLRFSVSYIIYFPVLWGSYIIVAIDDYLNGDDDFHKKIKKAANKIKWKMTQPRMIPRPE